VGSHRRQERDSQEGAFVDEEILSMKSFLPTDGEETKADYNRMKRTHLG
jgi:hypothetical protein